MPAIVSDQLKSLSSASASRLGDLNGQLGAFLHFEGGSQRLTGDQILELLDLGHIGGRHGQHQGDTVRDVQIGFNFVGRFVPPAFGEVELTPEELEEIRKREERKDRLHQNYLKRKANGKQKEYEERTKAKKKAEIEARKQAIRTEDIARGVFIPVSSLPQLGPRKGA